MKSEMVVEEEGGMGAMEEGESGQPGRADGRSSKLAKFIKLQTYLSIREVLSMDEIRLKFMRQGIDVSRSRLVSEGIKLLAQAVAEGKFELRG